MHTRDYLLLLFLAMILPFGYIQAQVMQSSQYQIQTDTINIGGGLSTSSLYLLEDSLGQTSSGDASSSAYALSVAGYQQNFEDTYITITAESDVNLPVIGGLVGGVGTGSSTWLVTTNNNAGYTLNVQATTEPALTSASYSFSDYSPAGPDPDFDFTVGAASSSFGFSPEGVDVTQKYMDNGSVCNAGTSNTTNKCWDGFSTTTKAVSVRNSANLPSGSITTILYRAEVGPSRFQESGDYSATITVTAIAL